MLNGFSGRQQPRRNGPGDYGASRSEVLEGYNGGTVVEIAGAMLLSITRSLSQARYPPVIGSIRSDWTAPARLRAVETDPEGISIPDSVFARFSRSSSGASTPFP